MPTIIVKLPSGAFDTSARETLARALSAVAKQVEQIGDDPRQEYFTWVLIEEAAAGSLLTGGHDPLPHAIPVMVQWLVPQGVLAEATRAEAVQRVHAAVQAAKAADDPRVVITSVRMIDVADGTWGVNGAIWRLPDFARACGFAHLRHLAATPH